MIHIRSEDEIEKIRSACRLASQAMEIVRDEIKPGVTTLSVSEKTKDFIESNGGEAAFFSAYEAFGKLKEKFSRLIHTEPTNIVVTESTTAAVNLAANIVRPVQGQNVVVTDLAFMSNTYPWLVSHPEVEVRFVKSRSGKVFAEDLSERLRSFSRRHSG